MSHVLIVDDEARISSFVDMGLRAAGFATTVVLDGRSALDRVASGGIDLIVLDLGLPDIDGLDVIRQLRAAGESVPIVVLTARDRTQDTVAGFETGANDYLVKPFHFDELLVRVRARLRPISATEPASLRCGDLRLDLRTRMVTVDGRDVELSAREFALAEALFRHPGQVLSHQQLLSQVWGLQHDPGSNVVEVYVGYLRRKIGRDAIATVRGMGYRLELPPRGAER